MTQITQIFSLCLADDTNTPPFFSRDTPVCPKMRCFVFAGRSTLRPYYPYEGWKNIKSAVIRIICVIRVPSHNS